MGDIQGNNQKIYNFLASKHVKNIGANAEEFQQKMGDDGNRRKVYDYLRSMRVKNIGADYDEFAALVYDGGQQNMGPVQTDAPMQTGTPQSRERTGMAPTALQAQQGGQPQKVTAASTASQPAFAQDQKWSVPQASQWNEQMDELSKSVMPGEPVTMPERKSREPEVNPFPYRGEDEKDIEAIRKRINDLQGILADVRGDSDFADEYDKRKREVDESTRGAGFVRGDVRGKDIGGDIVDGRKWLEDNKTRYGNAVEDRKAAKDIEDEIDQLKGQIQDYLTVYAKRDLEKAQDANREQMPGGAAYEYGVSLSPVGALASSVIDNENFLRAKAGEIYRMAGQELNQGSKYDPGYKGGDLEKALTAINQYAEGAANQLDTGSLTQGLSEGSSLIIARRIGDKYNKVITEALKGMKMSNGDMNALISFIDTNGRKLQGLVEELDKEGADLKTMNDTYEDMVRRGDPDARKYGMELQKRLDAYNKRVKEEYDPLRAQFDSDMAAYQKINEAIDAAVKNGMSDGDMAVLDALEKLINAKTLRATDVSTASKAGAGAEQSAEFMIDFILTGGISEAGNKVATKIATNRMLKKVGAEAIKDMAIKPGLGLRFATDIVTSGIRTAVMATRNLQAYGEQLTEYVGKDSTGRYNFDRTHLNAFLNTALTQYIEYWSEGFGSYFSEGERALFRAVTGKAPTTALGATLGGYRGSIGRYLEHSKFDGMFNEMLEEVVGAGLNGLAGWLSDDRVGDEQAWKQFWAGDNLATLTLSFLPMSIISAGSNVNSYLNMRDRYKAGEQMLNDFVKSGKIDQADVDYLREHASEMTPEQIKKRIMDISDKARPKNGGHLPGDFAKNMIGFVEGCFAADMRNEAWDESREKMAVVGAFTTAYNVGDAALAWDAAQEEQEAKTKAMNLGFTEEELDSDAMLLAREAAAIRETEQDRSQALSEYAVAKAQAEGLKRGYLGKGEKLDEKFENDVRQNLNRDGIVVTANLNVNGDQVPVFVLSDDATIGEGGSFTTPSGPDGMVQYRTSPNSDIQTAKASELSGGEVQLTDQYIDQQLEDNQWMRNALYEVKKNEVSPRGMSRMLAQRKGTNVVVKGRGAYMPVRVERMTDEGRKVAIKGDKDAIKAIASFARLQGAGTNRLEIEVEKLFPLLEREADGSLSTYEDEETKNTTEQEQRQTPQIDPNELPGTERTILIEGTPTKVTVDNVGGDGVWFHYTDAEGNERNSDMPVESFMDSLVDEQAPAAEAQEAQEVQEQAPMEETPEPALEQERTSSFPVDEKNGKRVFDHPSVTPEQAYGELMNGVEPGSKNEANRRKFIESSANKAAAALTEAQNKIAGLQARRDAVDEWDINDDEDIDAFEQRQNAERAKIDSQIAEEEAKVPELQRKSAHWDAVRGMANAVSSVRREAKLADRAESWTKRTGINVRLCRTQEEVDDADVKKALAKGERVGGWYNPNTGEVGLYLPNLANESEVDKTFIHEVVSHKGLKEVLGGQENYDALCDKVWDQLMSEEDRQTYLDYNSHLKGSEEFLRRAAADEWIAHYSETLGLEKNKNLFDKFVEFVKDILDRILGEDAKITKEDIANLLRSSLARYESERPAVAEAELSNSGIAANGEETRFSVRYAPSPEEVGRIARDISTNIGVSEEEAMRWVQSETSLAALVTGYGEFLDYKADDRYTAIKSDSDYPQGTVDFNNICRKRLDFTEMYQRVQKAFPNTIITGEDLATIRNIMKNHGLTVACGLCYVEDRRQLLGEIAKDFIDNLAGNFKAYESRGGETKKKNAEKFRSLIGDDRKEDLSIYDLITLDGSTKLNREHPGIYKAFQAFNSARGQQAGNLFQGYAEYKHEILNWSKAKVKSVNDNGGLRIFSYSDFEAHHLIDIVQIVIDCARKGVKIQGYTKVPAFARAVANTGIKLNRSLIPLGDTGIVDGKLAYDPVEGIDINDPDFLESNDNVGNILIGINDEQIRLAMADPFIHFIIPYHSNQSGVLRGMKQTGKWTNYKKEQTEKGENVGKHGVNIYTDVLNAAEAEGKPITNEREFTERFLAVCKEKGWTPRFARFLDTNEAGDYVYTPGYYKLLLDFKLFDENGNILPQNPVVAEFDDEFNAKILGDYVAEQEERRTNDLDPVYDEIVDALDLENRRQDVAADGSWTHFRKVEDPAVVEWFNNAPKRTGFRTVAKFAEGTFGSPMAGQLGRTKGKGAVSTSSFGMNEIEQSEENPDIADENGKVRLIKPKRNDRKKLGDVPSVDYNPYIHLRLDKINRQFKDAWKRDDLVYIESEVPEEEVPDFRGEKTPDYSKSPYHADKAKLPVGIHDWNGGPLMLSRYDRPFREVPWEEVADAWAADKNFQENGVHFDIVPPQIRQMLVDRGIEIIPPHNGMGQDCIDAYNEWKNRDNGPDGSTDTRFRKAMEEDEKESKELFDAAKERFGTTRDLHEAGYILPDGAMLDFSGRHMASGDTSYLNGSRTVDHRDIEDLNFERDLNTPSGRDTNMADFIGRGAIRIHMPGMINLAVKPTPEQVSVLERLINADNSFVRVDFGNGYNSEHFADYDDARPVRVINDINRYFDEGYMPSGNTRFRIAYHGSPNKFEEFDTSFVGDGQGHQSHGWGIYVSLEEGTARRYGYLGDRDKVVYQGEEPPTYYAKELVATMTMEMANKGTSFDKAKKSILDALNYYESKREDAGNYWRNSSYKREIDFFENLKEDDFKINESHRNLYKVDIPEDTGENYIDEQKNLKKPIRVKIAEAIRALPEESWRISEDDAKLFHEYTAEQLADKIEKGPVDGEKVYSELNHGLGSPRAASEFLSNAGFVGIKYVGGVDGPCAVIFKADDVKIEEHTRFRKVTPEQDAEYMDAVNSGDMEKAGRMVRDAFKAAFPDTVVVNEEGNPLIVFHGGSFGQAPDTEVDNPISPYVWESEWHNGWFSRNRNYAEFYARGLGEPIGVFLDIKTPFAMGDTMQMLVENGKPTAIAEEYAQRLGVTVDEVLRLIEPDFADEEEHGRVVDARAFTINRNPKFADLLARNGYDGAMDIEADGSVAYMTTNANQIKLADPVTYDDSGNIIPLSERFNKENNDIRFRRVTPEENREYMEAVKSFDNDKAAQILRDAFKEVYPDTKIVDENGDPLKVFHGSRSSVYFTEFDYNAPTEKAYASGEKPAYFFTSEKGARRYARHNLKDGPVIPAYLAVDNPYEIDYEGAKFTGEGLIAEAYDRKQRKWVPLPNNADGKNLKYFATPQEVAREFARVYPNVSYARLWDDFSYTRVHDAKPNIKDLMDSIDRDQYDGAIIKNIYEINDTIDDYVAFRPEQIKSADTVTRDDNGNVIPLDQRFNQEVKDIRFRRAMTEDEVREERIAEGERELTDKTLDSMPQSLGSGVMRVFSDEMPKGHESDKGYFNPETNTVSVCMDNVLDGRDAVATAIHETVGHKGLDGIFGEQYKDAMVGAYAALDADGRAWVNGYIVRNNLPMGDDAILRGMMEYMAMVAERNEGNTLDAVNDVLSQAVDMTYGTEGFRFTNRELAYILRSSFEHMKDADWLNTREGKAKDILMKRELGINESDENRQMDPEARDAGVRFRRGYVGNAVADSERENKRWQNVAIMEIQNADLPVKIAYEAVLKEKFGDRWEEKFKSLPENEDYLMRHNLSSSRADTENFEFMTFRMNPMLAKVEEVQQKLAGKKANTQKLRDAYDRVLNYLYAVSGLERNEWKRNNGGEARDYSGITALMGYTDKDAKEKWKQAEEEARAMVAEFERDVNDKKLLDELWDSIRACTDFSLDHAYNYGLLTKEEYERLRGTDTQPRMWNYYLPLRGFSEETAEEAFDYVGYTMLDSFNNGVVKEANGRWSLADSPLANIQNIAQREIVQGNENWSRQALLRFVRNTGKNSLLSERDVWYVRDADTGEWTKAVPEGEDIDKFEKDMEEKRKNGNAKKDKTGLDIDRIMANKSHENQHLIRVKTGGVEHAIWVNGDPAMAKAVTGIGKKASYQDWRAANRVFSNMFTTYSLDFTAKNLIRDTLYSRMAMLAKEDRKYRWTFEKNWWSNGGVTGIRMMRLAALWDSGELVRKEQEGRLSRKEQLFVDFMRDGGQTGYTVIRSVEKLKKDIEEQLVPSLLSKIKKKVVDGTTVHMAGVDVPILGLYTWGVRTLNEAFELLTRFTAYETSRDVGRSGQRAAYDAKEISVNFNRRGAQSNQGAWGSIAAYFGGTHYFFNAGVQGFDNFLRLFKTSPKTMTAESVAVMSLGFLTPWINSLLGGGDGDDDENKKRMDENWYWNMPEWVRRNNIVIRLKKDFYIAVPLPVEFRALYGLGDIARSIYDNKYPNPSPGDVTMDILSTASSILPVNPIEGYNGKSVDLVEATFRSVVPDIGIFAVDWVTNKDYTGRELVKKNIFAPEVPTSQGAYASTPKALVDACQWMGEHFGVDIAPGLLRDGLSNYLGGYYKFAEDLSKQLYSDDERPSRWDDIPFLSGFTGHLDEDRKITYVNNVLYEYKDVMENVVKKINLYNRSKDIKAKQAFTEEETLPDKAKIQKLLLGKDYNIAKMYYNGMEDEHTGEKERVVKVHKTGKRAGQMYRTTREIKIPGVNTLRKTWQDYREVWAKLPDKTEEEKAAKADAYKDMVNAWHEYYNAAADLADRLMKYEYEGTITE